MMDAHDMAAVLTPLKGSKIASLAKDGKDGRMVLELGSRKLFVTLTECSQLQLQPFANAITLVDNWDEIVALEPRLQAVTAAPGSRVRLMCDIGSEEPARLFFRAENLRVYNEDFDPLNIADLEEIQKEESSRLAQKR